MTWLYNWLFITSLFCTLPFWLLLSVLGVYTPSSTAELMGAFMPMRGMVKEMSSTPIIIIPGLVFIGIFFTMLYAFWTCAMAIMYGGQCVALLGGDESHAIGSVFTLGIVGWTVGFYLAMKYLPRIDAYFGVDNGLALFAKAWGIAGNVYMGVQAVKLGRKIIRKI